MATNNKEVLKFMHFARGVKLLTVLELLKEIGGGEYSKEEVNEVKSNFQKEFNRELTENDVLYIMFVRMDKARAEHEALYS